MADTKANDACATAIADVLAGMVRCSILHHKPGEYHAGGTPCPAEDRVKKLLNDFYQRKTT